MGGPEVLGEIIIKVFIAGLPMNKEVTLFHMVSYSVEHHIYCIGIILLDIVICNAGSTLIVYLYGSGRLRMTKLIQSVTS